MAKADIYESDNTSSGATTIAVGAVQTHSITAGDVDWIKFTISTSGTYTLQTSGAGDTYMYVYNSSLSQLEYDDDDGANRNARIQRYFSAGTYYAKIKGYSSTTTIDSYRLALYSGDVDVYENDDSRFGATTLTVGSSQSHTIHSGTDEDWYKFTVSSDGFYSIRTTGGDTILQLYSFEGQAFGYNDDRGNADYGSSGTTQLYAGTTYYARVTSYGTNTFSYTISLSSGVIADAWESNNDNSLSGATALSLNSVQVHTIHSSSDVDWVKFTITEAGYYYLFVDTSERDAGQMQFSLYDSSGTAFDLSGRRADLCKTRGSDPYLGANFGTGIFYVRLSAANSSTAAGEYAVSVSKVSSLNSMDADDYEDDGSYENATTLSLNVSQTHSLNVYYGFSSSGEVVALNDVDWFKFTPSVTGQYRFAVSGTHNPTRMTVMVADEDGVPLVPWGGDSCINPFAENYMQAGQTYYIHMTAEGSRMNVDSYTITATRTSTYSGERDNYEPDNSRGTASVISVGETRAHSIHAIGDQDWMKFTPTASGYYTFYTGARNGNAGDADIVLALYDSNGTLLIYDDDSFSAWNAMMSYNLTAGQSYYILAQSARNNTVVPYYTVSAVSGIMEDTYDIYMDERSVNDNTRANAIALSLGQTQAHTIHSSTDVDWVGFYVSTAGSYTIQTTGSGDTLIYVYDENGNYITYDDDSGVGRNASVTMNLAADTIYYARVSAYGGSLVPLYKLSLTEASGGSGDAYESDDTMATAKGIVTGETQSHSIHTAGDVDWVEFRPIQSGAYQIQTTGNGDMKLDLYSASGTLLASDDDSGTGLNARIGQTLAANTTYYIKAYAYSSSAVIDSYALNISLLQTSELGDEYENDNTPALAKPIQLGQTQTHSIHTAGDVDWVTFTPSVNGEYTIQTIGTGLNCDTQLYLYDGLSNAQSGTIYRWDDDSGTDRNALLAVQLTGNRTYYIKAKAYNDYTIPSYGLRVTRNNAANASASITGDNYESDDLSGRCKPIAVGREYTHSIHARSDTDWIRFFTHQTGTYTIQTTGVADMSFVVYKRIPGGRLVPYASSGELDYYTNSPESIGDGGSANNAAIRLRLDTNNWYYVQMFTSGRQTTTQNYGIRVDIDSSSVAGDAYEKSGGRQDDNSPSRATWITANQKQIHSIHTPGDQDWYRFKSTVSGQYKVELSSAGLYLYLYKKVGNSQSYLMRMVPMGTDNSAIFSLDGNTDYFFKVVAISPTATIGTYSIDVSYPLDQYESDDTSAMAKTISLGQGQTHSLHTATDVDWVKFTVTSSTAGKYIVENDNGNAVSAVLYKQGSSANTEVGRSPGTKSYANLSAGTYYVRFSSASGQSVSSYSVKVQRDTSIAQDSYESDNTVDTAKSITVGGSRQTHSLHSASDVDYVKFYASAGSTYTVSTSGANVSVRIQNAGSVLASDTGTGASTRYSVTSSGYYYARVASNDGKAAESYTVQVTSAATNNAENYAILYNGGGDASSNHWQYSLAVQQMYMNLVNVQGLSPDHIIILSADGTNSAIDGSISYYRDGRGWYSSSINNDYSYATSKGTKVYSATKANLQSAINTVSARMDSNDHLLFWATDHGSDGSSDYRQEGREYICGWGGVSNWITAGEFNSMTSKLTKGYQTFLFSTCFSGGILSALDTSSTSSRQRFGAAVASQEEFGWSNVSVSISPEYYDTQYNGYVANRGNGFDGAVIDALASGSISSTSQLSNYIKENASFLCDNSYSSNHVCTQHGSRNYADPDNWDDSAKVSHYWSTGSNFQIFARS